MAGNAVLTMVASSVCMKNPMATNHNSTFGEDGCDMVPSNAFKRT